MRPNLPSGQFGLTETLRGTFSTMLGRSEGLKHIDLSDYGFWQSFWALGLTALIDASAYSMRYSHIDLSLLGTPPSKLWYITGLVSIAMISYGISMLSLYLMCRTPEQQRRFPYAIIVNNWASLVISVLIFPLMILSQWAQPPTSPDPNSSFWGIISILIFAGLIYAGANVLQITLNITRGRAFGYIAVTTSISIVISLGLERLLGLGAG